MTDAAIWPKIEARWQQQPQVGDRAPTLRVAVRSVKFVRGYRTFSHFLSGRKMEKRGSIKGGNNAAPWRAWLEKIDPHPDYIDLPNVQSVSIEGEVNTGASKAGLSTGQSGTGCLTATIKIENLLFKSLTGALGVYHLVQRGALSPYLGYLITKKAPIRSAIAHNEWFEILAGGYQLTIWQGYGDAQVKTFTGIIDDADLDSNPDFITLTVRDFGGRQLQDQNVYGVNKAKEIKSPITFADRKTTFGNKTAAGEKRTAKHHHWILVDDAAEVVKWCLMWAGFQEWYVENIGTTLHLPITFHQGDTLMDIIEYICAQANFVFYMDSPQSYDMSIGVPVFRECRALSPASAPTKLLTDKNLLTAIQIKHSTDALSMAIQARGASSAKGGFEEGDDPNKRFQATYFPPWSGKRLANLKVDKLAPNLPFRLAGTAKYAKHTEVLLKSDKECLLMAVQIAYQEALVSTDVTINCVGLPAAHVNELEDAGSLGFHLDGQVAVADEGVGTTSRVWIRRLSSLFQAGENASYITTIEGALLDTPDMQVVTIDYDEAMNIAGRRRHAGQRGAAVTPGGDDGTDPPLTVTVKPVPASSAPSTPSDNRFAMSPRPDYAAGPLGGAGFTQVAQWNAGGPMSSWDVPAGEGRLHVMPDGHLSAVDPMDVLIYGANNPWGFPGPDAGAPATSKKIAGKGKPPAWWRGDKYAARWIGPGPHAGGYKVRFHFLLNWTQNDYLLSRSAVVVNMTDRQHGLAFFFGSYGGVGWTTDLRNLGVVQGMFYDGRQGQKDPTLVNDYMDRPILIGDQLDENATFWFERSAQNFAELWVELWRTADGSGIWAAIFDREPAAGVKPIYASHFGTWAFPGNPFGNSDPVPPAFDHTAAGYFGWTMSYMLPGPPFWPKRPRRGIEQATLFVES